MLKRLSIVPFEVAIALYAIFGGIAGLAMFGPIDPLTALLPMWEADALNILSLLTGLLMTIGISLGQSKIEQAGLLFLDGVLLSRFILYGHYFHYNTSFFVTGFFTAALLFASLVRSRIIASNHVIVKVEGNKLIDNTGD